MASLGDLADELHSQAGLPFVSSKSFRTYWDAFSYTLTEEDLQGFGEFLRYAFYHGVVPEVAEVHLWGSPDAAAAESPSTN
jgi:hypothetical protein